MNLDPSVIGWQEFWLRLGVMTFAVVFTLTGFAIVVRVLLDVGSGVTWAVRKMRSGGVQ